jgi:uncharacterized protein YeeX (DUF496 family)
MTKDEVKKIIDSMPQGMDVDDYLVEVVNRALFLERQQIRKEIAHNIRDWDKDYREAVEEGTYFIRGRT